MSPARRSVRRRDWPRGLYEPRPLYYCWRHPKTGETHIIGRVSLAFAKSEAIAANQHVMDERPSLVARISGQDHTMAQLVADMPISDKRSTRNTMRARDKIIVEGALVDGVRVKGLGGIMCGALTVMHCADLIDAMVRQGQGHQALAVRQRLISICQRGIRKGWMTTNPAEVTEKPEADVARARLSLEAFFAIREAAKPWPWLVRAMNFAIVTGQDRSTIAAMQRKHIVDGRLICHRSKTKEKAPPIAIPTSIRLDAVGLSLDDLIRERTGIVSPYLVHHTERQGHAAPGDPVAANLITVRFSEVRALAGIPDTDEEGRTAPTFHEIRSLSKRLYDAQGGIDTMRLLGHMTRAMAELYAKTRDDTPVEILVNGK